MFGFPDLSRDMKHGEEPGVDTLLRSAFGGPDEAELVMALRESGDMVGEMITPAGDEIIAYAGLSRMVQPGNWLCLAPVAVAPDWQGRKIGKRLVGMITEWARISGTTVVVLGQVGFYEKAGFSLERARKLTSPYPVDHTLLAGAGEGVPETTLIYPKAFG